MDIIEMKLPQAIAIQMPQLYSPAIEWCHYYKQFGIRYHLSNCPIHQEVFGEY